MPRKHFHYHIRWNESPDLDTMPFTSYEAAEHGAREYSFGDTYEIVKVDATDTCGGAR
jgi:hypothetical protein